MCLNSVALDMIRNLETPTGWYRGFKVCKLIDGKIYQPFFTTSGTYLWSHTTNPDIVLGETYDAGVPRIIYGTYRDADYQAGFHVLPTKKDAVTFIEKIRHNEIMSDKEYLIVVSVKFSELTNFGKQHGVDVVVCNKVKYIGVVHQDADKPDVLPMPNKDIT